MDFADNLHKLNSLAKNYWFCWNPEALELFKELNSAKWKASNSNPILLLNSMQEKTIRKKLTIPINITLENPDNHTDFSARFGLSAPKF